MKVVVFNLVCSGGEMLAVAAPCLEKQIHATKIISAFRSGLDDMLVSLREKLR